MAQQRQRRGGFSFSLPWVSAQAAPQPRPPQPPLADARSTLAQRRLATSQNLNEQQNSPPRSQQSKDMDSQKASPSRVNTQSRVTNLEQPSPSYASTRSRITTKQPSPSKTSKQFRTATKPPSTSRVINSKPPSPSPTSTQSRQTTNQSSPSQTSTQSRMPTQPPSTSPMPRKRPVIQPPTPPLISPQIRVISENPSPSRTMPDVKQTLQTKTQSPPTLAQQSGIKPTNHLSTSSISYKNEKNLIGPETGVEISEDKVIRTLDEKSEETIKGEKLQQEQKKVTEIGGMDVTLSSGSQEFTTLQNNLASDEEQKQEEEEEVFRLRDTLHPTNSTKAHSKTVISDLVDKGRAHISHHKNSEFSGSNPSHEGIKDDISKFVQNITNEQQKLQPDENKISVITLLGENRGALMSLGYESGQREGKINIRRGYKVNPHESTDSGTEAEKSSNKEKAKDLKGQEDEEPKAYINSNIQSINNSIMFNSSITERNPGVHFTLSSKVMEHVDDAMGTEPPEAHKATFNVRHSQKLSYKPVVRRRCLRGLFMESSDSEPDNPDKPRRHGCRYVCGEKSCGNNVL